MDNEIIPNAGFDDINESTYTADEVRYAGSDMPVVLPRRMFFNNTPVLNQMMKEATYNACGSFWLSKLINEQNWIEWTYPTNPVDQDEFRMDVIADFGGNYKTGSTMTGNLKYAVAEAWSVWRYRTDTIEDMKMAFYKNHLIYSGSMYIDWIATYNDPDNIAHFSDKVTVGHIMYMGWYDDDLEIVWFVNSYGEGRHDKWVLKVRYKDMHKLFTRIAVIDKKDKAVVDKIVQDRAYLSEAFQNKLWNGKDWGMPLKRYEYVLMLGRHKYWANLEDDDILNNAIIDKIWNGSNKYGQLLRYEAVLMIMRTVFGATWSIDTDDRLLTKAKEWGLWNGAYPYNICTREQWVIMMMRAISL